jgi:sodium pump decarboxylase gamma subunit
MAVGMGTVFAFLTLLVFVTQGVGTAREKLAVLLGIPDDPKPAPRVAITGPDEELAIAIAVAHAAKQRRSDG